MKHKHYDLIVAWADGAEVEINENGIWRNNPHPFWIQSHKYRIKPEPKPELQKVTMYIYNNPAEGRTWMDNHPNQILGTDWVYMGSIEVLK